MGRRPVRAVPDVPEETVMPFRCAVLDDFQNVATTVADWSPLGDRVEVVVFTDHFGTED